MTAKTTTKTTDRPRALPWARWNEELEREIAAHVPAEVRAAIADGTYDWTAAAAKAAARRPVITPAPEVKEFHTFGSQAVSGKSTARLANPITEKQINFIRSLGRERDLTKLVPGLDGVSIETYTTREASALIERLLALPKLSAAPVVETLVEEPAPAPARTRLDFSAIPDGNYAVRTDGVVKFYRVSTSKRSGYKNVQVRASDALYMQFGKAGIAILHRIVEAGLEASQMLFAKELGCCWKCGRTLTDETSRAIGMGPDCASK